MFLIKDSAGNRAICDQDLQGPCPRKNCNLLHSDLKMPYIWQIKISRKWHCLENQRDIEEQFCDKYETYDVQVRIHFIAN